MKQENGRGNKKLAYLAGSLLGNGTLEDIIRWYTYAHEFDGQYVVFLARRSYMLALVMEQITGLALDEAAAEHILTDGAFYLRCEELADYFRRNRRLPGILICDDLLIHGRGLNHFLAIIEERLCDLLYRDIGEDIGDERKGEIKQEIKEALTEAVQIHVFMRADRTLLLWTRYEMKLLLKEKTPAMIWRELSHKITVLIQNANLTYAAYIYTEYLPVSSFRTIDLSGFVATNYQNTKEYTQVRCIERKDHILGIFTLRIIESLLESNYRIAPFVLLPNLDAGETGRISKIIWDKLEDYPQIRQWLFGFEGIPGKRTFNELLTYIFSNAILQEFHETYPAEQDDVYQECVRQEFIKLSRNYDICGREETEHILQELTEIRLFTVDELEKIFKETISGERYVAEVNRLSRAMTDEDIGKIKREVEWCFYKRGWNEEKQAVDLIDSAYYSRVDRTKRHVRGTSFMLRDLLDQRTQEEVKYLVAFFLQMMDAGVAGVSSYASRQINVVGYAQFAKAGEQSLLVYPLRMYEYMPMLTLLQGKCTQWGWDMKEKVRELIYSSYWQGEPGAREKEIGEIERFIDCLKEIKQRPEDWNGNFLLCKTMEYSFNRPTQEQVRKFFDKQDGCLEALDRYLTDHKR